MVMWDYKDTELPFNTTDRSSHMKDMGGKGWELVSVSPNPESRCSRILLETSSKS